MVGAGQGAAGHAWGAGLLMAFRLVSATLVFVFGIRVAHSQDWPDLKDQNSFTFISNRLAFPGGVTITYSNVLGQIGQVSPSYKVGNIRLLFVNFYVAMDGSAAPERCPGNAKTVDFATVFKGEEHYAVTFGGQTSVSIPDCGFVWSDPIEDRRGGFLEIPAQTHWRIRSSQSVQPGQALTFGMNYPYSTRFTASLMGDGVEYGSTALMDRQSAGGVAPYRNGSSPSGPAAAIGNGWDGSPVFLVLGDSVGAGDGDLDYSAHAAIGFVARALDDVGSRRMNFAMWAVPGTRPQTQASERPGEFGLRAKALRSVPNRPFNRILSEMGHNGLYTSFTLHRAAMLNWWEFLRQLCTSCQIFQTSYATPHARQTNQQFWSTRDQVSPGEADGYPNGTRWQAYRWLKSGATGGLPQSITVLDVHAKGAFNDKESPEKWRLFVDAWVLQTAAAGTSALLEGNTRPSVGDAYAFEPGTANAEVAQAIEVRGQGPWTISFLRPLKSAHPGGAMVRRVATADGTHPGSTSYKDAARELIILKQSGVLR